MSIFAAADQNALGKSLFVCAGNESFFAVRSKAVSDYIVHFIRLYVRHVVKRIQQVFVLICTACFDESADLVLVITGFDAFHQSRIIPGLTEIKYVIVSPWLRSFFCVLKIISCILSQISAAGLGVIYDQLVILNKYMGPDRIRIVIPAAYRLHVHKAVHSGPLWNLPDRI